MNQILLTFGLFLPVFMTASGQKKDKNAIVGFTINAISGLQYDLVRFKVKSETKVKIILTNKSDEEHNLIVTESGERQTVVNAALRLATKGKSMNYIPEKKEVLWTIPILSPGQTDSVTFIAPTQPGIYPCVCTYSGHGSIMYGAIM